MLLLPSPAKALKRIPKSPKTPPQSSQKVIKFNEFSEIHDFHDLCTPLMRNHCFCMPNDPKILSKSPPEQSISYTPASSPQKAFTMTLQMTPRLQKATPRDPPNPSKLALETIIRVHIAADTPQTQPQKLSIIKINPKIMKHMPPRGRRQGRSLKISGHRIFHDSLMAQGTHEISISIL